LKSKRATLLASLVMFLSTSCLPAFAHQYSHSHLVLKRLGAQNVDAALAAAEAKLQRKPDDLQSLWIRAEALEFKGRFLDAQAAFAKLLEVALKKKLPAKDLASIYAEQGLLLAYNRRLKEGVQALNASLQLNPKSVDASLLSAVLSWIDARRDAIVYFNKYVSTAHDVDGYIAKAHYQFVEGKQDDALKTLNEAEKLFPASPFVNYERAYFSLTMRDVKNAEKYADIALKKFVFGGFIYDDIAKQYKREGKIDQQLAALHKLASCYPTKESYNALAGAIIERGKVDDAVKVLSKAHQLFPDDVSFVDRKCKVLRKAKRWKEALPVAQYRIDHFSADKSYGYLGRALVLEGLGDYKKALADFDKAIPQRPDMREAVNRARCNLQLKNYQACIDQVDAWLAHHPGHIVASELKARALFGMGKTAQALKETDILVQRSGENPVFITLRAEILQKLGRAKEAAAEFARAKNGRVADQSPEGND
jgi:tetratricopeptide (TPR) repeat protein